MFEQCVAVLYETLACWGLVSCLIEVPDVVMLGMLWPVCSPEAAPW
jgi:hypothetical protein